ncbi:MAG: Gfo/Idh/MocA family oxidoreductase [Armatimonadetes bacterium]|nr:Gfo/Idh/MocA family oxidoreductase [Armatimonadota bacterium]
MVAVIGTGSIGSRHLRAFRQMGDVTPVAVPVRGQRRAALAQERYATADDLISAAEMGATLGVVATDTRRHLDDALAALDQGMDLLVEKPLAVDAAQADRLRGHARDKGRRLFVGCVLRFSESLNRFRELLPRMGTVHSVRIECQSYLPHWRPARPYRESYSARSGEGGVLRDLIHEIDYAGWLYGWPAAVYARLRNLGRLGLEVDEAADLLWETPGGCSVSVTLDYLSRPSRRRMRAAGERGSLEWDFMEGTVTLVQGDDPPQVIRSSQRFEDLFLVQDRAFVRACDGYSDPRLATGDDGVRALAVCDAARRASESRRETEVRYP